MWPVPSDSRSRCLFYIIFRGCGFLDDVSRGYEKKMVQFDRGDSTFFQQMASEMQERNPIVIIASCSRMFNLDEYNFNVSSACGKTGFGPVLDGWFVCEEVCCLLRTIAMLFIDFLKRVLKSIEKYRILFRPLNRLYMILIYIYIYIIYIHVYIWIFQVRKICASSLKKPTKREKTYMSRRSRYI